MATSPATTPRWAPVTHGEFEDRLRQLWGYVNQHTQKINALGALIMSDQDQINAEAQAIADLAAKVTAQNATLAAGVAAAQAEIAALQARPAGTPLDFTQVTQKLADLAAAIDANAAEAQAVTDLTPPAAA